MNTLDLATQLSAQLDAEATDLDTLDAYLAGAQPAAFLSPESRKALGDRLRMLSVNFPRLVVNSVSERMTIEGFKCSDPALAAEVWRIWRRNRLVDGSAQAHTEALALGRAYVIVWAGASPETPRVTIESPRQVAVKRDPASGEITAAAKRWVDGDYAFITVYEPTKITKYRTTDKLTSSTGPLAERKWTVRDVLPNPLGRVPVVALVNAGRLTDTIGRSEMTDVLALTDAINKIVADMMVTSEFYARPRRWATGLEVVEDDEGNPINPFTEGAERVWQSESPETSFGQFDAARLDGYTDALASLTQQIGALSGLPPHYLGLHGDQPASADAIRSAEASLVATVGARMRTFGDSWAEVARLILAVKTGRDPESFDIEPNWADAETRTPAQAADAAAKLRGIGMALSTVQESTLGMGPEAIEADRKARRAEALDASGADLAALLP